MRNWRRRGRYHVLGVEGALDCGSRHDCGVVEGFAVDVVVVDVVVVVAAESCDCRQSGVGEGSERSWSGQGARYKSSVCNHDDIAANAEEHLPFMMFAREAVCADMAGKKYASHYCLLSGCSDWYIPTRD